MELLSTFKELLLLSVSFDFCHDSENNTVAWFKIPNYDLNKVDFQFQIEPSSVTKEVDFTTFRFWKF